MHGDAGAVTETVITLTGATPGGDSPRRPDAARQEHLEGGSRLERGAHLDAPVVTAHDLVDDEQAQADAAARIAGRRRT
jgi:hypothetical protein